MLRTLLMMRRQRDAELAQLGVTGATSGQRLALPIVEGLILVVTAAVPGLLAFGFFAAYMYVGMTLAGYVAVISVPGTAWIAALVGTAVIMVAATVLPTIPAWGLPERRVVARLVSE